MCCTLRGVDASCSTADTGYREAFLAARRSLQKFDMDLKRMRFPVRLLDAGLGDKQY